jgi:hypothetical protein
VSGEDLRAAIRVLLDSHANIEPSRAGHVAHAERYRALNGANIGLEPKGARHQNLFVEARAIRLSRLNDIDHKAYAAADYAVSKPNHDLFHADAFGRVDIIRFKVSDLWQAVRILTEVAGDGAPR